VLTRSPPERESVNRHAQRLSVLRLDPDRSARPNHIGFSIRRLKRNRPLGLRSSRPLGLPATRHLTTVPDQGKLLLPGIRGAGSVANRLAQLASADPVTICHASRGSRSRLAFGTVRPAISKTTAAQTVQLSSSLGPAGSHGPHPTRLHRAAPG
jgi:hypothetical protein